MVEKKVMVEKKELIVFTNGSGSKLISGELGEILKLKYGGKSNGKTFASNRLYR